jgi:zinc protease
MNNAVKTLFFVLLIAFTACKQDSASKLKTGESNGYSYEYMENDPLNVRIYTLKNGLKVYLSKYGAAPRIQTNIAVKAGGKNDPATNTGLAHYLEHIMFKGTADFGTLNWEKETVLLDSIEHMFTHYGTLTDSVARADYYKLIDNVSNEAAKYAIANEYDKMVSGLGAQGTNAYTTEDRTVYVNDIPANQVENWLKIEGNRFKKIVPRLFHTELEAVYEEKNRTLDNDYWKTYLGFNEAMFPKHQYGTQSVIGTIEHLKNPSITEIKKYFDTYYRPNNVAVCMSGDLDFDKTIALIDTYFGDWQQNEKLQAQARIEEAPLAQPVVKEILGPDAEWIEMGFRMNGLNSEDAQLVRLTDMILANSKAGLIDLNLKQQQKVIDPTSYVEYRNDYSVHKFTGRPREGQSLEQVKDLFLEQIEFVKKGEFEDWLIEAVINDLKKSDIQNSEYNGSRANELVMAFTNSIPWDQYVSRTEALRKYTKEDIVKFANEHYGNNYVVVYKRTGKDPNAQKVTKPSITKVPLNTEDVSPFHKAIAESKVEKLQPVYVDYNKDVVKLKMNKDLEVLYTPNKDNDLFALYYLSDVGTNNNPKMDIAVEYLQYVGTEDMTAEEIQKEFYKLGTTFSVFASGDQTYVYLEGLNENMDKSIQLFEKLLANAKADDESKKKMIDGIFKKRDDIKKDKGAIMFSGLMNYGLYGAKSSFTNVVTNKELNDLKSEELIDIIKNFTKTEHRVLYYGPKKETDLIASLNQNHILPEKLQPVPAPVEFKMQDVKDPNVYWADYDMVQSEVMFLSKGKEFDSQLMPMARLFNEYFGSIVFQELREAQGLAYSTFANYGIASKKKDNNSFYAYIGTQADKQPEGMKAMAELLQTLPKSENGFDVAKNAILNQIESQRITKAGILFNYETAVKRGLDHDVRKEIYEQVQTATLADVEKFQQENVKNSKYNVVLIGSKDKINFKELKKYGTVKQLTLDELFGYEKQEKINLEQPNQ